MKHPVTLVSGYTIAALALSLGITTQAQAQIVPTPTGDPGATGTIVTPINTQIDITGGTQAGSALFHSFTQFDVNQGQTANFQIPTEVTDVLTRVTNGNPSTINGTLQLSGSKAHFYLMNPAGIIISPNGNLNLPAAFIGTTANSIPFVGQMQSDVTRSQLYQFNAFGENEYANYAPQYFDGHLHRINPDIPNSSFIANFGKISASQIELFAGAIASTTDLTTSGSLTIHATSSPADVAAARRWRVPNPNSNEPDVELQPGDIITSNISAVSGVGMSGDRIRVGNIQGQGISLWGKETIDAGHLKTLDQKLDLSGLVFWDGISLVGRDIKVSSLFSLNKPRDGAGLLRSSRAVQIEASGTFQVTDTIPQDADFNRVHAEINDLNPNESAISILSGLGGRIKTPQVLIEGANLEHDSSGAPAFRLTSQPESRVNIIGVNPNNGSLILKNQTTGEITIGDNVSIRRLNNDPIPSGVSGTKGLILYRDASINFLNKIGLNSEPLPGSGYKPSGISDLEIPKINLPPEAEAAIARYDQQKLTPPTSEVLPIVPPTNPIVEPINPTPTPIAELVEPPQKPDFSEASILNGTIDPTDTINLSAGAIRGAAINPGGLLKVELDTRNPEGVLMRKVTTK
jgi:filamentous hemagglutinin family protein